MTIIPHPVREQAWPHCFFHFSLSRKLNSFHLLSNPNKATKKKYLERVNLWQNCGGISGTKGGGKWRGMPISDGKAKASREVSSI